MSDIYTQLFNKILSGAYLPGTKLKEEVLAEEYGISRTPVREALNLLSQDCLVEKEHRRGTRIIGFTVDDVEEIYEIRKALEIQAIKYAIPNLSIHRLKQIREETTRLRDSEDREATEQSDVRLHEYFIQESRRRRLIRMLTQVNRIIRGLRHLSWGGTDKVDLGHKGLIKALEAHLELIDALIMRDEERAVAILADHIEQSKIDAIMFV